MSFGKLGIKPLDKLVVFRKCFPAGSTRLKVYDTCMSRATKDRRLPQEAAEIFDEIVQKLRETIRETPMQRQVRAEATFEALEMGRLAHSAFRAEWEHVLEELKGADVDLPSGRNLCRRYLQCLNAELRTAVLKQKWQLDERGPVRAPVTWQEVAQCAEMELELSLIHISEPTRPY